MRFLARFPRPENVQVEGGVTRTQIIIAVAVVIVVIALYVLVIAKLVSH